MTDSSRTSELSKAEERMLDVLRTHWGSDYEPEEVARHLAAFRQGDESLDFAEFPYMGPEKKVAAQIAPFPKELDGGLSEIEQDRLTLLLVSAAHVQIDKGIDLVKWLDSYWVFEPSIEKILEFSREESQAAFELFQEFNASDHGSALNQFREPFLMALREWNPEAETAESISKGIEIYQKVLGILERGFPFLLGLKRILDGESPDIANLQERRAPSVRDELTDTENHPNSAYFDLTVKQYDRTLRNAISHGDIVHDASKSQVKIPNEDEAYSYAQFNKVAKKNFANGVFLTGLCQSLVQWRAYMYENDSITRDNISV